MLILRSLFLPVFRSPAARGFVAAAIGCGSIAAWMGAEVIEQASGLALPLDDAFIHLQYARQLSEGQPFVYVTGEAPSGGMTSPLWVAMLAVLFFIGLDGAAIILGVWIFGVTLHTLLVVETGRLAQSLAGSTAGVAAGSMAMVFGAFAWFALSGMETLALALLLTATVRVAGDQLEGRASLGKLTALAVVAPWVRPEGLLASALALYVIGVSAKGNAIRRALPGLASLLAWLLLGVGVLGDESLAVMTVKWLPLDPYVDVASLLGLVTNNVGFLFADLLAGGDWSRLFLPLGFSVLLVLGLFATVSIGRRRGKEKLAALVVVYALSVIVVCSYGSFLWHRLRYLWPFAPAWFVALSCLGVEMGVRVGGKRASLRLLEPLFLGGLSALLAARLPWVRSDLAQSARAVQRQQVALAGWAKRHLSRSARIGVNDAGALAYLSHRRTFDVVGLTTAGQSEHWIAGGGSRFEHYERMPRRSLPTHFIVYPQWFACPPLLGRVLSSATVADQSILGEDTMWVHQARYDLLGSGALPEGAKGATLLAELDVADIVSERALGYAPISGSASDNRVAVLHRRPSARSVADGGRFDRTEERFSVVLPKGSARLVARYRSSAPLTVSLGGVVAGELPAGQDAGPWTEGEITLELDEAASQDFVVHSPQGRFDSFHYWWFRR
ncbi:hypothetical protein JYT22_00760 [Endomicrobium sp. AH-315-J14]|nr:hypothetical protein [Endomicrobium sp. AH-315-J14]